MRRFVFALIFALVPYSSVVSAATFTSSMDSSTGWTELAASADDSAIWGFDYSTLGIPAAPSGAGTVGLLLESNATDGVGGGGMTVSSDQVFSGKYVVEFDLWGNLGYGNGTTEYFGGGIGHDQTTSLVGVGNVTTGSGGYMALVSDASSGLADYRLYKDSSYQALASGQYLVTSNLDSDGEFDGVFPAVDLSVAPLSVQGQTVSSEVGDPVFHWHHITISVDEAAGTAQFDIDSLPLGKLDANIGSSFSLAGAISLFQADTFGSVAAPLSPVSGPTSLTFSIYDNVQVTTIPEPTSLALVGFAATMLGFRRRNG